MTDLALAVDVGGTSIKGELVGRDGIVVAAGRRPTPTGSAARDVVAELGTRLLAEATAPVLGAGVVVPGLVDRRTGVAAYSANIGWRDLELRESLGSAWGLPVTVGQDVAAGGVAEHRLGAGAGWAHVTFLPIGTGIAAANISAGQLLLGPHGEVAEIGHLPVRGGEPCACGGGACLESLSSASAIARRYAARTGRQTAGADAVVAVLDSDLDAQAVWADAIEALAEAITTLTLLLAPEVVVIGGGLSHAGDLLMEPLREAIARHARILPPPHLELAAFGDRGALVGAALLAFDGWELP